MDITVINLENDSITIEAVMPLLTEASKKYNTPITVVVGSKDKFHNAAIKCFITEEEADQLRKNEFVKLGNELVLELESTNTISRAPSTPVLFVVYGWSEVIPKIKRAAGVKKLIVLAPNSSEADAWVKEFSN